MSTKPNAADTAAPDQETRGVLARANDWISDKEVASVNRHPFVVGTASAIAGGLVVSKGGAVVDGVVSRARSLFGGGAKAASKEVASAAAGETAKGLFSGGSGLRKLFR